MLFFFKNVRIFYRTFLVSSGMGFLYNLGIQKGTTIAPAEKITKSNTYFEIINLYIDKLILNLKLIPKFLYDLTHLNFEFISTIYYIFLIVLTLIFMYFLISLYSFFINFIDRTFLKKYDFPVCKKCQEKIAVAELEKKNFVNIIKEKEDFDKEKIKLEEEKLILAKEKENLKKEKQLIEKGKQVNNNKLKSNKNSEVEKKNLYGILNN